MVWQGVLGFLHAANFVSIPGGFPRGAEVQIVVVMGMPTATHGFDMNQNRSSALKCEFSGHGSTGVEIGWIRTIDRPGWNSHGYALSPHVSAD